MSKAAQRRGDLISRKALIAELESTANRIKSAADQDDENGAICTLLAAGISAALATIKEQPCAALRHPCTVTPA